MSGDENHAYVARVSRRHPEAPNSRRTVFYAAMASSKEAAHVAICAAVDPGDYVEMTDGKLSPETALALGLVPEGVKAM